MSADGECDLGRALLPLISSIGQPVDELERIDLVINPGTACQLRPKLVVLVVAQQWRKRVVTAV